MMKAEYLKINELILPKFGHINSMEFSFLSKCFNINNTFVLHSAAGPFKKMKKNGACRNQMHILEVIFLIHVLLLKLKKTRHVFFK